MEINKAIIANKDITIQAKGLYAYFLAMANEKNEVSILVSEITEDLNMDERTFRKYKNELEAAGVVKTKNRKVRTNKFSSNVYQIVK